ncbi:protein arginine methyltransferase NDUFAF7, mitochondrial isoform X1 [Schistocerca gregaria]|uniref:protein arginine methyltransferase NDUFAF7, mitochondrial isoform X1 n=1 Tax=Schistocerca gregaria TaxID=7010 RepID=UPI00211EEE8C|nr:protein arginine methyltransferase NDUFAF7, mitochondrial isoform X1 [Schistocerca gregaria]
MFTKLKNTLSRLIAVTQKRFCQNNGQHEKNGMFLYLKDRIKAGGPLTVAEYMRECLTNPKYGYYMHRDPITEKGDFITSPELSQMFGELIGVWILNEWTKLGAPKPLQITELGPGRGTLIADIMKVLRKFNSTDGVSLHLVEISQHMSKLQAQALKCIQTNESGLPNENMEYQSAVTTDGISVKWYRQIQDVPRGFSCIIAHEFFDALPVHKLQRTKHGWREVLIDIDVYSDGNRFRYVISRSPTPASKLFVQPEEKRDHLEVCPAAGVIVDHIASLLEEEGGFALIGDYGHNGEKTDTLRAFKKQKIHHPLVEPGLADLTADVDFKYLKKRAKTKLITFGPVTQSFFLKNMGIDLRLKVLLSQSDSEKRKIILAAYQMMVDEDNMGQRFKFLCMFPAVLQDHLNKFPVAGFSGTLFR